MLIPRTGAHLSLGCVVNRVVTRLTYKRTCIDPNRVGNPRHVPVKLLKTRLDHSGNNFCHVSGVLPNTVCDRGLHSPLARPNVKMGRKSCVATVSNVSATAISGVCDLLTNGTGILARLDVGHATSDGKTHGMIVGPLSGRCPLCRCG